MQKLIKLGIYTKSITIVARPIFHQAVNFSSLILQEYDRLVSHKFLHEDSQQKSVIQYFSILQHSLSSYEKRFDAINTSPFSIFYHKPIPPNGLYLYGDVGISLYVIL
jgi:predicted ATPase